VIGAVGDHLWQSTLFAAAVSLLALALRRNRAQVRYWLWLAASLKFLVPFAVLTALGTSMEWRAPLIVEQPAIARVLDIVGQPFSSTLPGEPIVELVALVATPSPAAPDRTLLGALLAIWLMGTVVVIGVWLARWRRVAVIVRAAAPVNEGRELEILRQVERRALEGPPEGGHYVRLVQSTGTLEPGIYGIARPVLLWPGSIGTRLTDRQVEAIVTHELAHVRRRDNLTAALHMLVQGVFWFHPAVWWIGARLVDERERACDQDVIRLGSEPEVYAEGILKTVQFYLESPLVCVSGVTGSDLKQRIEDIMHNRAGAVLASWQKALLAAAAVVMLAVPLVIGTLDVVVAAQTPAAEPVLSFESASVKPNNTAEGRVSMRIMPGGAYEALNVTVRSMIQQAFLVQEFQLIGGPDWLASTRIDILAKSPDGAAQPELMRRVRTLLEERFKLKTHRESREAPIYALTLARTDGQLGPSIKASSTKECAAQGRGAPAPGPAAGPPAGGPPEGAAGRGLAAIGAGAGRGGVPLGMITMDLGPLGSRPCNQMNTGGKMIAGARTMDEIAQALQRQTGRIVQNRTGLTGRYDFDLQFTPDPQLAGRGPGGGLPANIENPRPVDPNAISIFTAVQEQLGLKLESTRAPVDVVVIDSAERLIEN
jgi:uncharacterized protein (TIGR03435 family)